MQSLWWSQEMWFYLSKCATFPLDFMQNETRKYVVCFLCTAAFLTGFPGGSVVKNLPANAEVMRLIPGSGRSPEGGNGNQLHYSCLENSMDRAVWWATVHGVAKSPTWLSTWHTHKMWYIWKCKKLYPGKHLKHPARLTFVWYQNMF